MHRGGGVGKLEFMKEVNAEPWVEAQMQKNEVEARRFYWRMFSKVLMRSFKKISRSRTANWGRFRISWKLKSRPWLLDLFSTVLEIKGSDESEVVWERQYFFVCLFFSSCTCSELSYWNGKDKNMKKLNEIWERQVHLDTWKHSDFKDQKKKKGEKWEKL